MTSGFAILGLYLERAVASPAICVTQPALTETCVRDSRSWEQSFQIHPASFAHPEVIHVAGKSALRGLKRRARMSAACAFFVQVKFRRWIYPSNDTRVIRREVIPGHPNETVLPGDLRVNRTVLVPASHGSSSTRGTERKCRPHYGGNTAFLRP
jgi:hypothetical protein